MITCWAHLHNNLWSLGSSLPCWGSCGRSSKVRRPDPWWSSWGWPWSTWSSPWSTLWSKSWPLEPSSWSASWSSSVTLVTPHSGSFPSQHFLASLQLPISPDTSREAMIAMASTQMTDIVEFILFFFSRRLLCETGLCTIRQCSTRGLGGGCALPCLSTTTNCSLAPPPLLIVVSAHARPMNFDFVINKHAKQALDSVFP